MTTPSSTGQQARSTTMSTDAEHEALQRVVHVLLDPGVTRLADLHETLASVGLAPEQVAEGLLLYGESHSAHKDSTGGPLLHPDQVLAALGKLLPWLPFAPLFRRHGPLFLRTLVEGSASEQELLLALLRTLLDQGAEVHVLLEAPNILAALLTTCLGRQQQAQVDPLEQGDDRVALASRVLVALAAQPSGLDVLLANGEPCAQVLHALACSTEATLRFRAFDALARVAAISLQHLERVHGSGILAPMLQDLQSPDVLVALNAVEGLNALSTSSWGADFLLAAGVLERLGAVFQHGPAAAAQDVTLMLLTCGTIKFFAQFLHQHPGLMSRLPSVLESWVPYLCPPGEDPAPPECREAILGAVGAIGSTPRGSRGIPRALLDAYLATYGSLGGGSPDLRVAFLGSLSCLLGQGEEDMEAEAASHAIFLAMQECHPRFFPAVQDLSAPPPTDPLDGGGGDLVAGCKSSIPEVKAASYAIFRALATHTWGLHVLAARPHTLTFLLARGAEVLKLGWEWKYAIAQQVVATSRRVGADVTRHQALCETYVRQGPFYRQSEVVVATEMR